MTNEEELKMRTRLEELIELIEGNKIWDWIGDVVDWDNESMKNWEEKINEIVKYSIEKYKIENNLR